MTTAAGFDSLVRSLVELRDPVGVLSVYVGVDPRTEATGRPPWRISLDRDLDALRAKLRDEGPHARWVAFDRRLRELAPELARAVDPTEHGRGRGLFVGVGSGELHSIAVQTGFPTGATLGEVAHVLPLLAADEGAPMGVVLVGRDIVRALEARLGATTELTSFDVEPSVMNGAERKGPAASNPFREQHVVSQREGYERHVEAGHRGLLDRAAAAVSQLAVERHWELAVVAGDPRGGRPVIEELRQRGVQSDLVDRDLNELHPAQALEELGPTLASLRQQRDQAFVRRVHDAALEGGRGALGIDDTLAALGEGRVDRLLLDGSRDTVGAVAAQRGTGSELRLEPLVVDSAALRAFESGARVTIVVGEAADALGDAGGIAALLRW